MQLRICAIVASSCLPKILSGLFWYCAACGLSAISAATPCASRASFSLRAASRNRHQVGIGRWPGRSIFESGSSPASTANARGALLVGIGSHLTLLLHYVVPKAAQDSGAFRVSRDTGRLGLQ